ncbi:MAG: hypothetical protein R6W77_12970 [Trueperaceae bacterium]
MTGSSGRHDLPFHLEAQLRNTLQDVRVLAGAKGLEHAFAMELFSVGHTVEDALTDRSAEAGRMALRQLLDLQRTLKGARSRSDGFLQR